MKNEIYSELSNYPILFFGGKGGVGKTTHSAAFAVNLSKQGYKTLIISTDPAHSLGDVFAVELSDNPKQLEKNLYACELNPSILVDEYFSEIENTITSYTKPDLRKKIKEHLLATKSSPGAEEAAILQTICRYLVNFKNMQFDRLVFDTAPTGHTLRLFALPELMSVWTDGLLRQSEQQEKLKNAAMPMWKKKEDIRFNLFKAATQSRWQRAIDVLKERKELFANAGAILRNTKTTAIVFVMIPENLALNETLRAVDSLESAGLSCASIIVNQIIPATENPFWEKRFKRQEEILTKIKNGFDKIPKIYALLNSEDIRGIEALKHFTETIS